MLEHEKDGNHLKKQLERQVGYTFNSSDLIFEAFTHKSYCVLKNSNNHHNERLEFLGDALLGLVIAQQLLNLFKNENEGQLSKKRASLVNQEVLALKAKNLGFHELLILGPGEKEQFSNLKPRLLASVFEAFLGALLLDAGYDYSVKWIQEIFLEDIKLIKPDLEYEKDYKTRLQEVTQKLNLGQPIYKLLEMRGPSHKPDFVVALYLKKSQESEELIEKYQSFGSSKKMAEQKCAQLLLQELTTPKEQ